MKKLLIFIAFINLVYADYYPDALFATVYNIASNDKLNVRVEPNYHSKKITALPLYAFVSVGKCRKIKKSTWCKVYAVNRNISEYLIYNSKLPGWVNAKFLKFSTKGYVAISSKKNTCDYALSCSSKKCLVITDTRVNKDNEVVRIKTKKYPRGVVRGIGEMDIKSGGEGYPCGRLCFKIDDFLKKQKSKISSNKRKDSLEKEILHIVSILKRVDTYALSKIIHPKNGIVMTWNVRFGGKEDIRFTRDNIKSLKKSYSKKIHWGYTYGRGNEVRMSLYDYISKLTKPIPISEIKKLKNLKGFHCSNVNQCKGYEALWIDKTSKVAEYNWQGVVIIFQKYMGKWYIAGMLRDRWTI